MSQGLPNRHLRSLEKDTLYHLGYTTNDDLKALFGDVKFVCMGGSASRMESMAELLHKELSVSGKPENISKTDRFVMFKVGPVLVANHGMGMPSLSILLHELIKLLHYSDVGNPIFIRVGTSGGIGVEPGTIVIADKAYDSQLKCQHQDVVLGKVRTTDATFDRELAEEILRCHQEKSYEYDAIIGSTMGTQDFYEGQGRLDGAICEYEEKDKQEYLHKAQKLGIKNIEMEATQIASLCLRTKHRATAVCVTLLDRLNGDQVDIPPDTYKNYQMRLLKLVTEFIKYSLNGGEGTRKRASADESTEAKKPKTSDSQ